MSPHLFHAITQKHYNFQQSLILDCLSVKKKTERCLTFIFSPLWLFTCTCILLVFHLSSFLVAKTKIIGRSSEIIVLNLYQILPPLTSTLPFSLRFYF